MRPPRAPNVHRSINRSSRRGSDLQRRIIPEANHWMQASNSDSIATDGGAPATPTPVAVGFPSIDETSDASGEIYIPGSGIVDYIAIAKPGGYEMCLVASYPTGLTGYISVLPNLVGDAWTGASDSSGYVPASFSGTGGGVVVYRQPFEVLETAVVGTVTEVGLHATTWQNSGSTRLVTVTLFIKRLT